MTGCDGLLRLAAVENRVRAATIDEAASPAGTAKRLESPIF
jgi:hypothetical protein